MYNNFRIIKIYNLIDLFVSPARTFKRLKSKDWIGPIMIILIISLVCSYFLVGGLIIPDQINKTKNNDSLNQNLKEARLSYLQSSYHYISSLLAEIFSKVIYYPFLALLITLMPIIFRGPGQNFAKVLACTTYIGLINCLGLILDTIMKYKSLNLNSGFNLSLIIFNKSDFVQLLLKNISFFEIWQNILLVFLLTVLYKYSKLKSAAIVFGFWFIWKLVLTYFIYLKSVI